MATYDFEQVLVWDVNPGGFIRALRGGTVTVRDAGTDAVIDTVTSDTNGRVTFTTTDVATVTLEAPNGLRQRITAASAVEAAAAFTVSEDNAVATLVGDTGSSTRAALNPVVDARITASPVVDGKVDKAYISALRPLRQGLDAGFTCALQVLGDSTGNDPTDWPYLLAQAIAPLYPAFTVQHRLWDDATQTYLAPTLIQTGTDGVQYLDSTVTLNGLTTPGVHPSSGNLDLRVDVTNPDWTPSASGALAAHSGGAGFHSWWLNLNTNGTLALVHSPDGTTLLTSTSTAPVPFTDGARGWVRVVLIPDNGTGREVRFYTSTDGTTWTQLGTTVTGATSILFAPSATGGAIGGRIEFGGRGSVGFAHKMWECQIRDDENGPIIAPALPWLWEPHPLSAADSPVVGAPTLTFVNGSHPGATIAYHADTTRAPKLSPLYGQVAVAMSLSHNQGTSHGPPFLAEYQSWATLVSSRLPIKPTIMTQNPETDLAPYGGSYHYRRRLNLLGYPSDVIDTFQSFLDAGWPGSLMADSVHPNATGSAVWRDAVLAAMGLA